MWGKESEEEYSISNPLCGKGSRLFNIYEYCKINKINIQHLLKSDCFICYEKLSDCKTLCIPHDCNHLVCYKCFCNYCDSLKIRESCDIKNKVSCSICRKPASKEWKDSKQIRFVTEKIKNTEFRIALPTSLHV